MHVCVYVYAKEFQISMKTISYNHKTDTGKVPTSI